MLHVKTKSQSALDLSLEYFWCAVGIFGRELGHILLSVPIHVPSLKADLGDTIYIPNV